MEEEKSLTFWQQCC